MILNLSRRKFLKAGGALMALPFLPSLAGAKSLEAVKPAKRLIFMYAPNGLVRRCFFPGEENGAIPEFMGGFEADKIKEKKRIRNEPGVYPLQLTQTMQPLAPHQKDITLVTGLDRPFKNGTDVHAQGASCYLTSYSPHEAGLKGLEYPLGKTLDHVIGDVVGKSSIFKTMEISCNGFRQGQESMHFDNISWYDAKNVASSTKDPRKLYDRLFMSDRFRRQMNDVTDLMLADSKALARKLGREDQETMTKFMASIREIELRIQRLEKVLNSANLKVPAAEVLPRGEYIAVMTEIMLAAMQMGMTNICTFMLGPERWESPMLYETVFDKPVVHHSMTHEQKGEGYKGVQKIDQFHMQQYANLIARMKTIKEPDGTSLLDNSIVTYGAGLGDGATHQFFDLPLIVAGGAQGQLKQGRFVKCKSGTLNSNMWLTLAQLMGLEIDHYADSSGIISELKS